MREPAVLLATWFGVGRIPFAAGTWGSLAALPLGWIVQAQTGQLGLLVAAIAVALAGVWASSRICDRCEARDPGFIVIDEVAAMLLTLVGAPLTWWGYLVAFLLFRAADIVKPWPANYCDRNVHGAMGVMLDDLVAGFYACLATWVVTQKLPLGEVLARFGL